MKLLTIELMYVVPNDYHSSLIVDNVAINNTVADLVGRDKLKALIPANPKLEAKLDKLAHNKDSMLSTTTLMQLMQWSHQQTISPLEPK